jgi:pre-mRNA-processing factor SLU7
MTDKEPKLDQDGKMINPHNPDFITKVPWYLGNSGPTLKHHTVQKADHVLSLSESDALIESKLAAQKASVQAAPKTVYRKGACKNCGALTHKEKDCVERPRSTKKSAWKSGLDIAPDEVVMKLEDHGKVSFDAKRDQWKGYDTAQYQAIIDKHERLEQERVKQLKEEKEAQQMGKEEHQRRRKEQKEAKKAEKAASKRAERTAKASGAPKADGAGPESSGASDSSDNSDSDSDYGSDEDDHAEETHRDFVERDEEARDFQGTMAPQGGIGGNGMRQTVRNLRLREDTPKYLRNLALDSAFYDPKSRAMRANPTPDENPEDLAFAGDNFIRYSGDAVKLAQNQLLCWEMQARGEDIDVLANPSQAELLHRQFAEKKQALEKSKQAAILAKYTDGKASTALDPRLRLGQTEAYVEYNREGKLIRGAAPQVVIRTKYEEDVYTNNHTSVWGSYYNRARATWGYACCHSCMRNAFCTGAKGRVANDAANSEAVDAFQARKMLESVKRDGASASASALTKRSDIFGESSASAVSQLDAEKLAQAKRRAEEANAIQSSSSGNHASGEERKRGYNSMQPVDVTLEDMEVYRMKKVKADDPMAALLESDTLLEYK